MLRPCLLPSVPIPRSSFSTCGMSETLGKYYVTFLWLRICHLPVCDLSCKLQESAGPQSPKSKKKLSVQKRSFFVGLQRLLRKYPTKSPTLLMFWLLRLPRKTFRDFLQIPGPEISEYFYTWRIFELFCADPPRHLSTDFISSTSGVPRKMPSRLMPDPIPFFSVTVVLLSDGEHCQ